MIGFLRAFENQCLLHHSFIYLWNVILIFESNDKYQSVWTCCLQMSLPLNPKPKSGPRAPGGPWCPSTRWGWLLHAGLGRAALHRELLQALERLPAGGEHPSSAPQSGVDWQGPKLRQTGAPDLSYRIFPRLTRASRKSLEEDFAASCKVFGSWSKVLGYDNSVR